MRERCPGLELTTHNVPIDELVAGVRAGRFDAAFTRPPLVADLATRVPAVEPVCAVLPAGHPLATRGTLRVSDLAAENGVLTPRGSWPPWHAEYDRDFAAAGFTPTVVQRADRVPNLLGLVAAGVGVTRPARSARSIRRTGVVFVPLADDHAETVVAWMPTREGPALRNLLDVTAILTRDTDITSAG